MNEQKPTKRRSQIKYMKENVRRFTVDVNRNTEPEVLAQLEKQQNVAQYIKRLIREDIK